MPIAGETVHVSHIQNSMSIVSPTNTNAVMPEQAIRMSEFNISSERAIRVRDDGGGTGDIDITDEIYATKMQLSIRILASAILGLGFMARSF